MSANDVVFLKFLTSHKWCTVHWSAGNFPNQCLQEHIQVNGTFLLVHKTVGELNDHSEGNNICLLELKDNN